MRECGHLSCPLRIRRQWQPAAIREHRVHPRRKRRVDVCLVSRVIELYEQRCSLARARDIVAGGDESGA